MADDTPPRQRVCGKYEVQSRVGGGGFASVWRATSGDGREVAVKFPQLGEDASNSAAEVRERFERAYHALSRFEGGVLPTSIVRFIDGHRDEPMCVVTELVDGEELSTAVTRSDVSPGADAMWSFGVPIARALALLHSNGYIYLDCKPENIIVRSDSDRPVLIDFNTAESRTETNDTLYYQDPYKAPEQVPGVAEDIPSDAYTDVYAVGKLLAFLLTGQAPDTTDTPTSGMDIEDYGTSVRSEIAEVIRQATRADPDDRQQDCLELVTQLYRADDRSPRVAGITDVRNDVTCPVRPGDTLGRVAENERLPDISVADSDKYISPIHLKFDYDDGWLVHEASLNGTYIKPDDEWRFLLSESGYRHLRSQDHPRVQDGQPYEAARLVGSTRIAPVDTSYSVAFEFDPESL